MPSGQNQEHVCSQKLFPWYIEGELWGGSGDSGLQWVILGRNQDNGASLCVECCQEIGLILWLGLSNSSLQGGKDGMGLGL